jgi:hypothetical protein
MTIKCSQGDGNIVHDSDNIDKKDHDNDDNNIDYKDHNEIKDTLTVNIDVKNSTSFKPHKLKIMTIGKLSAFLSSCVVGRIPCKPEEIEAFNIVSAYYICIYICICLHSVYVSVYIHIHIYNLSIYILIRICMFIYML